MMHSILKLYLKFQINAEISQSQKGWLTSWINTMFIANNFPEFSTNLVTALQIKQNKQSNKKRIRD